LFTNGTGPPSLDIDMPDLTEVIERFEVLSVLLYTAEPCPATALVAILLPLRDACPYDARLLGLAAFESVEKETFLFLSSCEWYLPP
jgi:hypothetical protein